MRLRLTTLTALTTCATMAMASDFEEGGLEYNHIPFTLDEVEVTQSSFYYIGDVEIPSTVTHGARTYRVTRIGDEAFRNCTELTSVSIPAGVTSIGDKAFDECESIVSISIPASVSTIGKDAFCNCWRLSEINIPENVRTIMSNTFRCCYDLKTINIPSGVRSIEQEAFGDCFSLTHISIPNGIEKIADRTFAYCESLTSVSIPEGVSSIGNSAFCECVSLLSITIPESVRTIGSKAFEGCHSLTSIMIPAAVESIGERAFSDCPGLETFTVAADNKTYDSRGGCDAIIRSATNTLVAGCQNTIIPTDVVSIANFAFHGSTGLTSVSIPRSVRSIGYNAFSYCITGVLEYECICTDIYVQSTTPPSASEQNPFFATKANTLHVPIGAKAAYEAASGWRNFHIVDDIERPTSAESLGVDSPMRERFKTMRNGRIVIVSGGRTYDVLGAEIK